jgi:F-type H+-transporting ATPase subunit b
MVPQLQGGTMKGLHWIAGATALGLALGLWLAAAGHRAEAQQTRLPGLEPQSEAAAEPEAGEDEAPGRHIAGGVASDDSAPEESAGSEASKRAPLEVPARVEPGGHVGADASDGHAPSEGGGDAAHGHGEEVDTNPLSWKTDLAIWTAVVFLVLLGVLWRFAWGPIMHGLDKRERGIADQIAQAEQQNAEAKKLLEQYDAKLAAAQDEVRQILDAARRDAEQTGREMVEKAQADAEAERQRALRDIDAATAAALQSLAEQSATLAVDLAGKIVGEQLDPKTHSELIGQTVSRFAGQKPSDN